MKSGGKHEEKVEDTQQYNSTINAREWFLWKADENSKISIVSGMPCLVSGGKAYLYDVTSGNFVDIQDEINTVYSGDEFIALDNKGHIVSPILNQSEYGTFPLGSAARYDNAAKMLDLLSEERIQLMENFLGEYCVVYLEDGRTMLFANGKEKEISNNLDVVKLSGTFILTKDGTVYKISHNDDFSEVSLESVSDEKFLDISACQTAERCIGIRQDGTLELWSNVELNFKFSSSRYEKVFMGFDYAILLFTDGHMEYCSGDEERVKQMNGYFKTIDGTVIDIAVAADDIAVLLKDGRVVYIQTGKNPAE